MQLAMLGLLCRLLKPVCEMWWRSLFRQREETEQGMAVMDKSPTANAGDPALV